MPARNRISMAGVLVFAGKAVVSSVVLILAAGLVFQWCATRLDERRYPMPGILVEVNGHRMHLDCRGEGSPTVLLDAGLGDSASTWALVQPEVAKFTRVCAYDRGMGGAKSHPENGTAGTSRRNWRICFSRRISLVLISWWDIPSEAITSLSSNRSIRIRLWALCWSIPRIRIKGIGSLALRWSNMPRTCAGRRWRRRSVCSG